MYILILSSINSPLGLYDINERRFIKSYEIIEIIDIIKKEKRLDFVIFSNVYLDESLILFTNNIEESVKNFNMLKKQDIDLANPKVNDDHSSIFIK